jgi:hypothetical protein
LRSLVNRYRAQIAPTNGNCAGFLHNDIVPILHPYHLVLYLGDFDLCGNAIEANTRRVLEHEAGDLNWERLALTREQIETYDLPVITKYDRRFKDGGSHDAVETEALGQRFIVDILRTRLDDLLPEPLERVQEREEAQRTELRRILEAL